jgi:hypothetical protein
MIVATLYRPILLALALAASVCAQTIQTLSVTPNPAPAGKAFQLLLQGVATECNTAFSRESVTVSGTRIDLRYTKISTGIVIDAPTAGPTVCPMAATGPSAGTLLASMPVFTMPALKAGKYQVWATYIPECLYSQPSCKIAVMPESAGTLAVQGDVPMSYMLNPAAVPAGQAFALQLLSYGFTCATAFDELSAVVTDSVITLAFSDQELPKGCMDAFNPYGPTFQMPAMKAGSYKVKVKRLQMNLVVDAGILLVTGASDHKSWYLKQRSVPAEKAFAMQLLRDDIGNCQTSFTQESASVVSGGIYASFVMESHPERVCVMDLRPFGPTFSLPGLKAGPYPVYPEQILPCQVSEPRCLLPIMEPVATDTLIVTKASAILLSELRARGPRVEMRGRTAFFTLPNGETGIWHARLSALDGRLLREAEIRIAGGSAETGAAGREVSLPMDGVPARTVSLLQLTAPSGAQTILPIVR